MLVSIKGKNSIVLVLDEETAAVGSGSGHMKSSEGIQAA